VGHMQSCGLKTSFQGLGLKTLCQGLGLAAKVFARDQDQDLIQWQGCTYLPFLNWPMFTSDVKCSVHLCKAG